MDIIDVVALKDYLGTGGAAATDDQLTLYVALANEIVTDSWSTPVDPAPAWVRAIAFEAAARPARNPRGLQSITRSVDDGTRTERLSDRASRSGVYLYEEERALLANHGRPKRRDRFGTVRTVRGW